MLFVDGAMAANDYHFISNWKVTGTQEEVCAILEDAVSLAVWWPSVYLDVKVLEPGNEKGQGKVVELYTKGFLPYSLRWKFKVTSSNAPFGYTIEAIGDFKGKGIWSFVQKGEEVEIEYDWRISAEKGLLKNLSFLLKPLFSWNHQWAMKKGEESLKLELLRKNAKSVAALNAIPAPPQPTFPHNLIRTKIL